jgi:hypothetical protein
LDERERIKWSGLILSIQPRSTVWRYISNNRTHRLIGYNLFLEGESDEKLGRFVVAVSEKQLATIGFRVGDEAKGAAWTKLRPELEFADYYRAGALERIRPNDGGFDEINLPPWIDTPPDLKTYAWRGCRVLSKSSWSGQCFKCKWAAMATVTIAWYLPLKINKYRFESFCYGPKSCKFYKRGRTPVVPYKNRGSFPDEEGGFDEIETENRDWDD